MTSALADYLQALTTRCEQATKGPWRAGRVGNRLLAECVIADRMVLMQSPRKRSVPLVEDEANAAFIAHARTDIPRLLAAVRMLREALGFTEPLDAQTDGAVEVSAMTPTPGEERVVEIRQRSERGLYDSGLHGQEIRDLLTRLREVERERDSFFTRMEANGKAWWAEVLLRENC